MAALLRHFAKSASWLHGGAVVFLISGGRCPGPYGSVAGACRIGAECAGIVAGGFRLTGSAPRQAFARARVQHIRASDTGSRRPDG